jgi:hypothetical protein
MMKQLKNHISRLGMLSAVAIFLCMASTSMAEGRFTFKLDQHETVLNDQATVEVLEAAIAAGLLNPNDPQVAFQVERAELQQQMSDYNAKCTLITSAINQRAHPTISIGNGLEDANENLDGTTSTLNIIGFKITLGSTANLYNFGNHTLNNLPALGMVVPDNTTLTANILAGGNTLSVAFGNGGLEPGQMSTMQIQLLNQNQGPTDPWPLMTDFFSESSLLTVIFQNPTTLATSESGPFPFADFMQHADMWQIQLNTSSSQHLEGFVDSYVIDNGTPPIIPEPSCLVLALGSLGGYLLIGRRRAA